MKILLVHQGYPPASSGGSELYTEALARALAREHQVSVVHPVVDAGRPDLALTETEREGVRIIALNTTGRARSGFEAYRDPGVARAGAAVLDRLGPELVHFGHLSGLSTGLVFAAQQRGLPVVFTLHDFGTLCPLGQLVDLSLTVCPGPSPQRCLGCVGGQVSLPPVPALLGLARRLPWAATAGRWVSRVAPGGEERIGQRLEEMHEVLRAADVLISPSRFLRQRLEALGVEGIRVLANFHPPLWLPPSRPDPEGRVRFGFVGAAIPSKGVHVLAEAFSRLADPRAALQIHGGFPEYHGDRGYQARVRGLLGPQSDALRGPFPPDRRGEVLAGLDVLVVPSIWEENAPLIVEEAFLAQRPLIVSGHGGLAERVRDGIDGLWFPPGDAAALADRMRSLLEDAGLRARLGRQPPAAPGLDEHVRALGELYQEARQRRRQRRGRVGVVVLDHGRPQDAARAARSAQDPRVEPMVLVVENGPGPPAVLPAGVARLSLPENLGYAGGMNRGFERLRLAGCDRVLLLNNDARLEPDALRRLAEALDDPRLAAASPVVLREADGRIESCGARFDPRWGRQWLVGSGEPAQAREGRRSAESLSGAVWMVRASAWEQVGPLDEGYFFGFEETEWCLRARRMGLELVVVQGATARHRGSQTLGPAAPERLYYACRNHFRVADRLLPLTGPARWVRGALILARNLAFACRQDQVPRGPALAAAWRGARDAGRGRFGAYEAGGSGNTRPAVR